MTEVIHKAPQRHCPYRAPSTQDPMKHLLLVALTAATLLASTSAKAHHDGDHKHQDTQSHQGSKK